MNDVTAKLAEALRWVANDDECMLTSPQRKKAREALAAYEQAQAEPAWRWFPEQVPAVGTECVVMVHSQVVGRFADVDKWDVQREDPLGMGGPTIETGEGWNGNYESDVFAWFPIPPLHQPPKENNHD